MINDFLQLPSVCEKTALLEAPDIGVTHYASSTYTCIHLNEDNAICAGFHGSIGHMKLSFHETWEYRADSSVCSHPAVPQFS